MVFNVQGSIITIEGLALGNCQPAVEFPSGLITNNESGSALDAVLATVNASFGFNQTPHSFRTTWIPAKKFELLHGASGNLPLTGRIVGFNIGDFLVSGMITHADYRAVGNQGTIVNIDIQDTRACMNRVKIHTEDLSDNPGSGIVSVARGYRVNRGLFNLEGQVDDALFFEYRNILENGCTYPQVLEAIQLAVDENELDFDVGTLPTVAQLEGNLSGTSTALRFQFAMTPLSEVVSRICQDTAYDWYWSMSENTTKLVNRKVPFALDEQQLLDVVARLGGSGLETVTSLGFGNDIVQEPRRVRLLGGRQEGFINSHLIGPIDGLDTPPTGIVFEPAWRQITASFNDADGILRSYIPSDKELQIALNGIESWTFFKKYQNSPVVPIFGSILPSGFGLAPDAGSIAAQHPDFESRLDPLKPLAGLVAGNEEGSLRVINNRRDQQFNWVLDFFARVEDHAQRHFGKSYVASGILVNASSGKFDLTSAAWGNIENQIEGQPVTEAGASGQFVPNYEIARELGPLSPFKTTDDKISAYVRLPAGTVYGQEGDDAPASFASWTEDAPQFNPNGDGSHYVPIQLDEVGQESVDPRGGIARTFEAYPDGTILCQLPVLAGSGLNQDLTFGNLVTLVENALGAGTSGLDDIFDLSLLVEPYERLSGVAIPVISRQRYGVTFPDAWVSGQLSAACDAETVVVDDFFVPWNFPPQGTDTSLDIMNDRAFRKIQGAIIPADTSQFANVDIIGLPTVGFDSFADQTPNSVGQVGVRNHGVTDITLTYGNTVATSYKVASFFSEFGREAPLGERNRAILNGIINPIDYTEFQLNNNLTGPRSKNRPSPGGGFRPPQSEKQTTRISVTISEVNNAIAFGFPDPDPFTQERYRGTSAPGQIQPVPDPFSSDPDRRDGAICIDGFLNLGDEAIYVVERILTRRSSFGSSTVTYNRYFEGGRPFANGTVVEVISIGSVGSTFQLAIEGTNPRRKLVDVPILNGAINVGDKSVIVAEGGVSRILGRPGTSLTPSGTFVQGAASSVKPAEVVAVVSGGDPSALVTVQILDISGLATGSVTGGVFPLPIPEFVQVGDRGTFSSVAVPSGNTEGFANFFFGNRERFLRFS